VGEKVLVRIEEVGRSAATAAPLDPQLAAGTDGAQDGDGVESRPRRRGRRGGRRRSAAKAPAES
jgi:ribonuclease G